MRLRRSGRAYYGPCPVHGGDNPSALTLYLGGEVPGLWQCYTRHCQDVFRKTVIGFVRGVLSARAGWCHGDARVPVSFAEAVRFCSEFTGVDPDDIEIDARALERERFVSEANSWGAAPGLTHADAGPTPGQVRPRLAIPSRFFVGRGYSPAVLDEFDVGECGEPGRPFFGRAVVPVYRGGRAVGFTARSVHGKCPECSFWHPPGTCPGPEDPWPKWRHSKGFHRESLLYNWDQAGPLARSTGSLLLVEGPGCLWRAVEAGCRSVAAIFGSRLSEPQQVLVEMTGLSRLHVGFDNDAAGEDGFQRVREAFRRVCKVYRLKPPGHDLGESCPESVRALLQEAGLS